MNTILRNFFTTLRRFRLATTLNIVGLSLAFASLIIILIQTKYDLSFDRFHPKADRIYRLEQSYDGAKYSVIVSRNMAEQIQRDFPQIKEFGLRKKWGPFNGELKIDRNGTPQFFNELSSLVHPDFIGIFGFEFLEGNPDALKLPNNIILSETIARRFFGDESAVGKQLRVPARNDTLLTVGAVYRDFPKRSLIENVMYSGLNPNYQGIWDGWSPNYEMFITLSESVDPGELKKTMLQSLQQSTNYPEQFRDVKDIRFTPLTDIYYTTDVTSDPNPKGSKARTYLLLGMALLIVFIAFFNFVNFSISLVPLRINSINIQKVLGSNMSVLRGMMVFEAMGISFIACTVGLILTVLLEGTPFASYLNAGIDLKANIDVAIEGLGLSLAIGAIAGLYPAFYATRFPPALVLKGNFGLSPKGRLLRTGLVSFQYLVSIGLIIAALAMNWQNRYLQTFDKGYNTSQIAVVELNNRINNNNRSRLISELKQNPQIKQVGFSQFLLGSGQTQSQSVKAKDKEVGFYYIPISHEFLSMMGIEVVDGRDFRIDDETNGGHVLIANKQFMHDTEFELNSREWYGAPIVGVVNDINFRTLHTTSDEPLCFCIPKDPDQYGMVWTYVRIEGNPHTAVEHIRKSVATIDPNYPVDVMFYDEVFNRVYQAEHKATTLISVFSLLAIIISIVGVLGLVFFETQYRRREIGLRKVYGSTVGEIIAMFNIKYLKVIGCCFVAIAPVAWWGVNEWLKDYAYRTPIHWWLFAVALIAVAVVTVAIITLQSWRAATDNPVKALKTE